MVKTTKDVSSNTEVKKDGVTSSISVAFDKTIELIKKNGFGLFVDLLKINAIAALIGIALLVILAILWLPILDKLFNFIISAENGNYDPTIYSEFLKLIISPDTMGLLIISTIIVMAVSIATTPLSYIQYNAVDLRAKNSSLSIGSLISQFQQNFIPVISYTILISVIMLGLFVIPILSFIFGVTNPILMLVGLGTGLISVIASIIFMFLIQFSPYELVIKRKGPLESLKSSYGLVKSNVGSTFLFDIMIFVLSIVVSIVLSIITYPAQLVLQLGVLINPLVGYLGYFGATIILEALTNSILLTLLLPLFYFFWKKISGE
ncbi:hypothetical protein HYT84_04510 [Candidatus Micrarchaeota archaeon]|nr:hypothetical protein [Candidatus Micrarchaeota archaeon]